MRLSFILFVESLNWYYAVLMHSQRLLTFIKQSLLQCSFTAHNEIYAHETVEKNSSFSQPPPEILSPHSVYNGTKSVYDFFFMEIVFSNERGVFLWRDGSMSGFYFFFFFVTVNMKFWNFIHFKTFFCLFFLLFACTNRLYNLIRSLIDPGKNIEIPGLIFPVATLVTSVLIGCI